MLKKLKWQVLWRSTSPSRTKTKKDIRFIKGDWNAKVRSKETRLTDKFDLGVQNEAGQRLTEFCQESTLLIANYPFQQHKRWLYTRTSRMVNTEIRFIVFFAAKKEEARYSQWKQNQELTVAQIMNSLFQNSGLNRRK